MKKLITVVAVLACVASMVSAQTVTSANVVGYSKASNVAGLQIGSAQFNTGDNTPEGLFGDQLPLGSKIYKYVPGTGYAGNVSTYDTVLFGGTAWTVSFDLGPGVGYWVESAGAVPSIVAGQVPLDDSVTNNIVPGLQLMSYPYPVARTISQMNLTPTLGDKIYKYVPGTGYAGNVATFDTVLFGGTAWTLDLTFEVGQGFWYESAAAGTVQWVELRPFTP